MATPAKREQVANRVWIDLAGVACDEDKATGCRYEHLKSKKSFTYQAPKAVVDLAAKDPAVRGLLMLGIFGTLTLAGNYASQAAGSGGERDTSTDPTPLITEKFAYIIDGEWPEREGGVGPRYDKEKLAQAIASVVGKGAVAKTYLDKMDSKVDPKSGAVSTDKGAISYGAWALRNSQVKQAYDKLAPVANAPAVSQL